DEGGGAGAGGGQRGGAGGQDGGGRGFLAGLEQGEGGEGIPRREVRHRGRRGGPAQCPVDRLQGARGIVPGGDGGRDGIEDGEDRLHRRDGHPAHPQVRARIRGGREVRQPEDRGVPEHDGDDAGRVERSHAG